MNSEKHLKLWFVTGSQNLYGPETLRRVANHSQKISNALNTAGTIFAGCNEIHYSRRDLNV